MKQIIAIIQPHRLEKAEAALHRLDHLPGVTLFSAQGHPFGQCTSVRNRPSQLEWNAYTHDRAVLMRFCADEQAPVLVEPLRSAAI